MDFRLSLKPKYLFIKELKMKSITIMIRNNYKLVKLWEDFKENIKPTNQFFTLNRKKDIIRSMIDYSMLIILSKTRNTNMCQN